MQQATIENEKQTKYYKESSLKMWKLLVRVWQNEANDY